MPRLESFGFPTHRETLNSQITKNEYVPQETPHSCGIAAILTARNVLSGDAYPHTVNETLALMKAKGYKTKYPGRTSPSDRRTLVSQLNEYQGTRLVYKSLEMPSDQNDYFDQLQNILNEGGVAVVGFVKPYFELPEGAEVEKVGGAHAVLVHGIKKGPNGNRFFIVTDPEPEISKHVGMNIEVPEDKFYQSLSPAFQEQIEIIFTAV